MGKKVESDSVVVNDGEQDGDGSNVVAVDDGDSEEGGDGSNVDVNENDGGEITEDEAINDGESNIAAVEGNEGGTDAWW